MMKKYEKSKIEVYEENIGTYKIQIQPTTGNEILNILGARKEIII